jgi:hypothetical protein
MSLSSFPSPALTDESGNTETRTGNFEWTDGRQSTISEYRLQRDTSNAIATEYLEVPPDIAALPDLQGYGNVYDLQQATARDRQTAQGEGLKVLVVRPTISCKNDKTYVFC